MRDIGMTADDVSFSSAITSCEKGGQWVQALVLRDKMLVVEMLDDMLHRAINLVLYHKESTRRLTSYVVKGSSSQLA